MPKTYNVQDWIKGEMQAFSISDSGDEKTGRDPVVVAEVFVNEDLGQSQEEAEAQAVDLASLFASAPALKEVLEDILKYFAEYERDYRETLGCFERARKILSEIPA